LKDHTPLVVALAGNPNSGKTSIFNYITGSRQHVGNYPGVTVERKEGTISIDDARVTFVDIPGTYSLSPYSLEEHIARDEILSSEIDAVVVVVDSARLERNLYLAAQIIETGKPVVLALNMYDEFEDSDSSMDLPLLASVLGVPCVATVGNRGTGITELKAMVIKVLRGDEPARGKPPVYSHDMEHAVDEVSALVEDRTPYNLRWTAINLLMYGSALVDNAETIFDAPLYDQVMAVRKRLEVLEGRKLQDIVTAGRYGWASGAVSECVRLKERHPRTVTEKLDSVMLNRFLGFPIFLLVLWVMFQVTFTLGAVPQILIERFFALIAAGIAFVLPNSIIESLIVDGVIAGVGGVLAFLPSIALLFLFISVLEDTGYMARAAFIMDRVMHFFGLHGKSFLPMLVGFGCTVPAIMATRILEHRRDRIVTMLIVPFMSCGARLPVYILLAGAFFGPSQAGNVIFSIYLMGIALSLVIAKILSLAGGTTAPFVMELPPYRMPTLRSVLLHIWERTWLYIRKAGTIILAASVVLWFLMSFPRQDAGDTLDAAGAAGAGPDRTHTVEMADTPSPALADTYAGQFGRMVEPVLRPLGYDWRIGVALAAGFTAKEVIISALATSYAVNDDGDGSATAQLQEALRSDPQLDPVRAYGLMLFILVYVPCLAVINVLRREAGGWKWVAIMIVYTTTLAWSVNWLFLAVVNLIR
jgi:ferrous iron transport protein B